ncbi:MAG TPA: ATP-grasp domain-containing protein [bacterium]|nr:ATP-grasp domain-containing protein [bacterium]
MNVVFVEPAFPANQQEFVRGLHAAGARVFGVGERPLEALPGDLVERMVHYERIGSVVDEGALTDAVRRLQERVPIDRLEATVEAHVLAAAQVRERCGIPGISVETTYLCRDKPAMKEVLRNAGIPTAASTGASSSAEARDFARATGYPLILKPRAGAGAAGTYRVNDDAELEDAIRACGLDDGGNCAVEEFVEGHEGFFDTIAIGGRIAMHFVTHYFPNVLEAMRTRWISPQFIVTNRVDAVPDYDELKVLGRRVIEVLGIDTAPTHMEWFFGPKGLRFSEIGCRPPGVGCWDLYRAANDLDIYREWANAVCWGQTETRPSRRYSAGIINLRPDRDGHITGYEGLEFVKEQLSEWFIDWHLPEVGTPTQSVDAGYMANAWVRLRHPDYDELRRLLDAVGRNVQVRAE